MEKLREFVSGNNLYKVLILLVMVASILLLVGQISAVRAILDPMYTTIRMMLSWVVVLGVVTTSSLWIVDKGEDILQKRKHMREEAELRASEERAIAEAEAERERQAKRERERVTALIEGMSDAEREIFRLVLSGAGCGVWLSKEDATVQTLMSKGLIERIGEVETWQDWEGGYEGRAWCLLAVIPAGVKAAKNGKSPLQS